MSSRNRQCDCGSGKRFKHCCGALSAGQPADLKEKSFTYDHQGLFPIQLRGEGMDRFCKDLPPGRGLPLPWSPPGLAVVPNFLTADKCDELVRFLSKRPTEDAKVEQLGPEPGALEQRLDQQRVTKDVATGAMRQTTIDIIIQAFQDVVTPYFNASIETLEEPAALKYEPGGKFDLHADSEHWSAAEQRWVRSHDRDYSVLLYLNDGYEGGAISFPNFKLQIQPQRGMLLTFPSDHRFTHEAEPLIAGERYVLVSWGLDKATTKI